VLLVDDNAFNLKVLSLMIEPYFTSERANSGF